MRGKGPAKGAPNAGRPPDLWKAKLRSMASRDEVMAHVESVLLAGPTDPFFAKALEYVTEHGYGKAANSLDVTSKGESIAPQTIIFAGKEVTF